jgi:hypothetical protein
MMRGRGGRRIDKWMREDAGMSGDKLPFMCRRILRVVSSLKLHYSIEQTNRWPPQ